MLVDHPNPKFNETPLAEKTEDEIDKTFCDFNVIYKRLRGAILEARQLHSDKVTVYPSKPWAKT